MKYFGVDSVGQFVGSLWIWQFMSLTSGKLLISFCLFLGVCVCVGWWEGEQVWEWGEPLAVGIRTPKSRSDVPAWNSSHVSLGWSGTWISCSHCACQLCPLSNHSFMNIVLTLHYILLTSSWLISCLPFQDITLFISDRFKLQKSD